MSLYQKILSQRIKAILIKRRFIKSRPKLIITDFDGCLTDDHVYTDADGIEFVKTTRKDGLGANRLKALGVKILIFSTESNLVVTARANKMNVSVIQNVADKGSVFKDLLEHQHLSLDEVWYIGNDINDIPAMIQASYSLCPNDAAIEVRRISDVILPLNGGNGLLNYLASLFEEACV